MKKRLLFLALVVPLGLLLACSFSSLVPLRNAGVTATPTKTAKPTFTATLEPSDTPVPSDTPTSTPMPTDTPVPTDTPLPTDTVTPTSTPAPTATATPTPRPTSKPKPKATAKPQPTKEEFFSPPPPPFSTQIRRGWPRCDGYSAVTGNVWHSGGSPYEGVAVGVWSKTWIGAVDISKADGKFTVELSALPVGHYFVAVVKLDTCIQQEGRTTAIECERLSNVLEVTKTEHCEVNRVTEVDIYGP